MLTPHWFYRIVIAVALVLPARAFPTTSRAQEGATPNVPASDYEVALSAALDAYAKGEYEAARMFLERAHGLEPSARTFRGLGIVAFAQKRYLDAIRALDQALASGVKLLPDDLRKASQELLSHAWSQVGRIEVAIDPGTGDFMIDGAAPDFYAPNTMVLAPGEHLLTARAPARAPFEMHFVVKPGDHRTLQVVLAVPPAPEVVERLVERSAEPSAPSQTVPPKKLSWYTPRARWTALGVAGGLLVGGATLWGIGYAKVQEVDADCHAMTPSGCTRNSAQSRLDSRHVGFYAVSSGTLLGLGATVLVTVGVLELLQRRPDPRRVELRAGPTSLALHGRF